MSPEERRYSGSGKSRARRAVRFQRENHHRRIDNELMADTPISSGPGVSSKAENSGISRAQSTGVLAIASWANLGSSSNQVFHKADANVVSPYPSESDEHATSESFSLSENNLPFACT
jgi:hypothetical protein